MALTGSYLDIDELAARTLAPPSIVYGDFFDPTGEWDDPDKEARREQWRAFVDASLVLESSRINARLRKRYDVPFDADVPEVIRGWLSAIMTPKLFRRRGVDMSDEQMQAVQADADTALAEIKEAADSADGLFDLPLKQTDTTSAVTKGGPLGYSEASPYTWTDRQREAAE